MSSHYYHLMFHHDGREGFRIIRISSSTRNEWLTSEVPLPFVENNPSFVAACKELFCLSYDSSDEYVLWNPFTNEYKIIPPSKLELPSCDYDEYHSTCTRFSLSSIFGLGFDAESGDYKLVKFTSVSYSDEEDDIHSASVQISIYSLNKNSWKKILNSDSYDIRDIDPVSLSGVCYWNATKFVVAFNLTTEEFFTFPFPDIVLGFDTLTYLIEFDGLLAFVVCSWYGAAKRFRFWIMDVEDGIVVWVRKEKLDVCGVGAWNPLGSYKNGCSLLLQGRDGMLKEYDYFTRKMKSVEEIFNYPLCMSLFSYVESPIKLNPDGEQRMLEREKKPKEEKRIGKSKHIREMKKEKMKNKIGSKMATRLTSNRW